MQQLQLCNNFFPEKFLFKVDVNPVYDQKLCCTLDHTCLIMMMPLITTAMGLIKAGGMCPNYVVPLCNDTAIVQLKPHDCSKSTELTRQQLS